MPSPTSTRPSLDAALAGYGRLVEILSAARTPDFPDPHVTMAQMRVLMLLSAMGEARMSDLVPKLGISLSTLSTLVDRLVDAGLALRRDDPRDRRNVLVSLTPAGSAMLDQFQELGADHLRLLLGQLSETDLATVNQAIELLVAAARRLSAEEPRP
jgi:DNA-binding MarR family transcriptional regulator